MRCRTEMYAEYLKKYFLCSEIVVSQCILTDRNRPSVIISKVVLMKKRYRFTVYLHALEL